MSEIVAAALNKIVAVCRAAAGETGDDFTKLGRRHRPCWWRRSSSRVAHGRTTVESAASRECPRNDHHARNDIRILCWAAASRDYGKQSLLQRHLL